MSEAFAPPGLTANDLWIERPNPNDVILVGVAYGIFFVITLQTLLLFLRPAKGKISWPMIVYFFVMFSLSTVGFAGDVKFNQLTYIDNRNIPGGPNAFAAQYYHHWVNIMAFTSYTILNWIADGLVLWRFILIWNYNYRLAIFPRPMLLGAVGTSIALIIAITKPNADFWVPEVVKLGISYWSLSISLNTVLTFLIVARLIYVRRRVQGVLGDHRSDTYTSVAEMLIGSASLYSIWGLVFLVCYAKNTPFQNLLLPALGQVQGIAPALILLRVAQGRAWSKDIATQSTWVVGRGGSGTVPESIPLSDLTVYKENRSAQYNKFLETGSIGGWEVKKPAGHVVQ